MKKEELATLINRHNEWLETAGVKGQRLNLDGQDIKDINITDFPFDQVYLSECCLSGLQIDDRDFYESEFYSCDFTNTSFVRCVFRKVTFDYCSFRQAHFMNCEFPRAEIYQSCFAECVFEDCSFTGINMMESDMTDATLKNIDWDAAYINHVLLSGARGEGAENIQKLVQPKISVSREADRWIEGDEAFSWLQEHMTQQ